jgi:hypothetical protein
MSESCESVQIIDGGECKGIVVGGFISLHIHLIAHIYDISLESVFRRCKLNR